MKRTIKSFTLIELLVVIVIIGILSGVIVISVTNYINDAKNTKIVAELSNLSKSFEGNSNYYVGSLCIEDSVSNPAFKTYYGLTSVPVHPNYVSGSTSLTTNNCYLYFSDGDNYSIRTPSVNNKGYLIQESRHPQTKPIQKTCDTGWIPFGNRCVMKYEASSDGTTNCRNAAGTAAPCPVSETTIAPWVSINQFNAKAACESIGAHLMTNAEWMALARDIEQVASNWTGGTVGLGVLKRGNVGDTLEGDYNGADPETGIPNSQAMLKLSNGEEIYYFSGNVQEWVDEKKLTSEIPDYPSVWVEINSITYTSKLPYKEVGPLDSALLGEDGVGKISPDNTAAHPSGSIHGFRRGGYWGSTSNGGVFSLYLNDSNSHADSHLGFRCVK